MTTNEKVARRKLNLLELAKELNNVSKACKLISYSRQQFYEIRRNYQTCQKVPSVAVTWGRERHDCWLIWTITPFIC